MAKPQAIEVKADDCVVTIGDVEYRPHEGESVWVVPGPLPVRARLVSNSMRDLVPQLDAAESDEEKAALMPALTKASIDMLEILAPRLVRWNWTSLAGHPLPVLNGTTDPLLDLDDAEVAWLITAVQGETPSKRKND